MRVLHVASEYPPQQVFGLGRYVADLSRHMALQGHVVHVLTNSIGTAEQDVEDHGVAVHRVDFPPPPKPPSPGAPVMAFNLHLQQRAHTLGRSALGDPAVIVSHDWLTALAGHRIAERWGLPHVWTVHDTVHGKRGGKVEDPEDVLAFSLESWAARNAGLILVNSRAVGDEIAGPYGGKHDRIRLLYPGLDPGRFELLLSAERIAAFRSVLATTEEILVTYCGRLDLEKGLDTLINAFSVMKRTIPKAKLVIAGRGKLQPLIEEHIARLDLGSSARLLGYLEGPVLDAFYQASDIHVCPSHYEPFGLVALEAMASGTAIVVSATGGLKDIVSDPSVGRTVPPKDVDALGSTLIALGQDAPLRKMLGRAGRERVRKQFLWSTLAATAAGHYESLIKRESAA